MGVDRKLLLMRLKEVFGDELQDSIASTLKMSQGNVSKMLTGSQMPTVDTVAMIANSYKVSVDWLLGLSEIKSAPAFECAESKTFSKTEAGKTAAQGKETLGTADALLFIRNASLIEEFLGNARRNIFMTGSTFVNLTRSESTLAEKLRAGLDIRLLLWDACNETEIAGLIEHQGTSRKKIENEIKVALALLVPMQKKFTNLEVCFYKTINLTDYIAVDIDSDDGLIKVQNRFYHEIPSNYPNFLIQRKSSPIWFGRYKQQIESLWMDAVPLDNGYLKRFEAMYGAVM